MSAPQVFVPLVAPDPVATIIAAGAPQILTPLAAPDGQWRAEVAAYGCTPTDEGDMAYEQLTLTHTTSGEETIAATQPIACGGLGAYGLAGLFWSANSRYLYFTTGREGVPDGCGDWVRPITRFDVSTRLTTDLGGGVLSPDQTRLAARQGRDLVIWMTESDDKVRVPAARADIPIGPVAWSPDSQALVYLQVPNHCPLFGPSALVRLDFPAATQTVLLESSTPTFAGVRWDDPATLTLLDADGVTWRYDLATRESQPAP